MQKWGPYDLWRTKNWEFLVCYESYFIQFRQVVLVGELVRHCISK